MHRGKLPHSKWGAWGMGWKPMLRGVAPLGESGRAMAALGHPRRPRKGEEEPQVRRPGLRYKGFPRCAIRSQPSVRVPGNRRATLVLRISFRPSTPVLRKPEPGRSRYSLPPP